MTTESSASEHAPTDTVADIFDTLGLIYEKSYHGLPEQHAALDWLLARLPSNSRILDIGSGTGRPTAERLERAGHRITGIDVSTTMVELAKTQVPAARFEAVDVRAFTGLTANSWDAVCAFFSLLSMSRSELDATLATIAESLVPGGYFIFSTVPGDWQSTEMTWMGHRFVATSYPADTFRDRLVGNGLRVLHHGLSTFQPDFPGMGSETQLFIYAQKPEHPGA